MNRPTNRPLNIAIADDEPLARLRLQQLCEDLNSECPNTVVAQYEHGSALINAMPSWQRSSPPDVLLLDINMPGLNGIEIAAYVRQHAPSVAVVFITAEPQHALTAFEVAASDYVLKPVRAERLLMALRKVSLRKVSLIAFADTNGSITPAAPLQTAAVEPAGTLTLRVHAGDTVHSVALDDVLYFKSDQKTTRVRTLNAVYSSTQSLLELESWLAALPHDFVRVHRNALLRRSAAGELSVGEDIEVSVLGVAERLQVSRRMLPSLRA